MKRIVTLSLLAALAGCANTIQELRETGATSTHAFTGTPEQVAACIVRNAENNSGSATVAQMRPGTVPGRIEITVRSMAITPTALLLGTVDATPSGSVARLQVRNDLIFSTPQAYVEKQIRGC